MQNTVCIFFFAIVLGQAFAGSLVGIPITTPVTHFAILTADQNTNPSNPSSAQGIAIFNFNVASGLLIWEVIHNVVNATLAHIHGAGLPGTDAGVQVPFASGASPIFGNATLNSTQEGMLQSNLMYVNIHSAAFPGGEIRGQILLQGQSCIGLLGPYGVPPVLNTSADGHALVTYDTNTMLLTYYVQHNVTNATAAHFHGPAEFNGTASPLVFLANSTAQAVSPITGSQTVDSTEDVAFTSGLNYINIHSSNFPNGEVRGQVWFPNVQYAIPLDGTQNAGVTSSNLGVAVLSVSTDNSTLNVAVMSTIPTANITGLHIHGPAGVGSSAGPIVFLAFAQASYNYYFSWNSSLTQYLTTGQLYINVHSNTYPNGELRGQLVAIGTLAQLPSTTGAPATGSATGGATGGVTSAATGSTAAHSSSNDATTLKVSAVVALLFSLIFVL